MDKRIIGPQPIIREWSQELVQREKPNPMRFAALKRPDELDRGIRPNRWSAILVTN